MPPPHGESWDLRIPQKHGGSTTIRLWCYFLTGTELVDISDMDKFGYVYRVTNLLNRKTYIGQRRTSRDSSWEEYYGSGLLVRQAIAKYGKLNFSKTLIAYADSQESLTALEASAIRKEWASGHGEYNLKVHVPSPDSWTSAPANDLESLIARRAKSLRETALQHPKDNPSHIAAEARWVKFLQEVDSAHLVHLYATLRNVEKVAKSMGVSKVHVKRYLRDKGLLLPSRTESGRRASEEERIAIANGLLRSVYGQECAVCSGTNSEILCKRHRTESANRHKAAKRQIDSERAISAFKKLGSIRAASRATQLTPRKIKEYLIEAHIEIPKQSTAAARAAKAAKTE